MEHSTVRYISNNVEETKALGLEFAQQVVPQDVILLNGGLGVGKTQFTQGLAAGLGIDQAVVSPTFNLLQEYHSGTIPLYHFDLYRLESEDQLEDLAFYEILEADGLCVVEWANKFLLDVPGSYVEISISTQDGAARVFSIMPHGKRAHELLGRIGLASSNC